MKIKAEKYHISYTLKNPKPGEPVFFREGFSTKAAANLWLRKNKAKIYWHQFRHSNPKSKRSRPVIQLTSEKNYVKKIGTLQTHYETGMECLGLTFYEDGVHGGPNPEFDSSKPEGPNNFKFFSTYDGLTYIENGQILQFPDGKTVMMLKDRDFAKEDGYRLSFYPQGYTKEEWLSLFSSQKLAVIIWIPLNKHEKDLESFIRGPFKK